MTKKFTVSFEPGCFDDFEGTQEELDAIITMVKDMAEKGTLFNNAELLDDAEYTFVEPVNTSHRTLH